MYYVYVIQSQLDGRLYKGSTVNLKQRLDEHQRGKVKSTSPFRPWKLIYYEVFANKTDALIEEEFLKSGKGRSSLKIKLKNYLERWPSGCQPEAGRPWAERRLLCIMFM